MTLHGTSIIAGEQVHGDQGSMYAVDPATGDHLETRFSYVGERELDRAATLARDAFDTYRATEPRTRMQFLERIADNLDAMKDEIVDRACLESGLAQARIVGEHSRTTSQLRKFANELRLGAHQGVRIDTARTDNEPAPPDLRQRMIPIGPVAVFGASNFPLAFSTAGGDTASALAAGCPVIVKAHSSHAGTAELAGQAIARAVDECDLPAAVFALLFGRGTTLGQQLAAHPDVKAIAFTGSQQAGTALMRTAAERDEPIPVYAEMSSINPVVLLPGSLASGGAGLAAGFLASLTLGSGQFCTNPGLVFVPKGDHGFADELTKRLDDAAGQTMLSAGISDAYDAGIQRLRTSGVRQIAEGLAGEGKNAPAPALFTTTVDHLLADPSLQDEVFGAAALLVEYADHDELVRACEGLQGQLTATVHMKERDHDAAASLLPVLERKAGRIIFNDWPTGVEVTDAMTHGGPFPATSDGRTTSVGTLAIQRFQRPVTYQNVPQQLLPTAVRDENPRQLPRRVRGSLSLP